MRKLLLILALSSIMTQLIPFPALPAKAENRLVTSFDWTDDPWAGYLDVRDDLDRTRIVRGFNYSAAEVTIPAFTHRGVGGIAILDPTPTEAWFRYYLHLDRWNASSAGKLPGFAGLYGSSARGCIRSTDTNPGWSARTEFRPTGADGAGPGEVRLGTYLYHLDQAGDCGDQILWQPGVIQQNRWYCIEGHVRMNALGQADGRVDAWVDGVPALRWPDIAFRRASEDGVGIRDFWMNIYFGGSTVNSTDLVAKIDQAVVSDIGRIGCLDPFSDDNGNVHEADITELHARGLFFGCADDLACPDDSLTRAQMAALLQRALALPSGADAFSDDDGLWAEDAINAVAAAGITKGCEATKFCPDAPVTRAQMAVFLQRGLDLPDGADAFSDDDGLWAENAINAVAAAGITKGCEATKFCPYQSLTRAQMATFLRRALGFELPPDTLGYAGDHRIGEISAETIDDASEPAPILD